MIKRLATLAALLVPLAVVAPAGAAAAQQGGHLDAAHAVLDGIAVRGWVGMAHNPDPVRIRITASGREIGRLTTASPRPDVARRFPAYGPRTGFAGTFRVVPGRWQVCATTISGHPLQIGCATVTISPIRYVALGDSYTSGPSLGAQAAGSPANCARTAANYPNRLAHYLRAALTDVSCAGAAVNEMTHPQGGNPPQLDALSASTQLVTLEIGINNVGYDEILERCSTADPSAPTCQSSYQQGGQDVLMQRVSTTGQALAGVLAQIRQRAPHAFVIVLPYLALWPASGTGCYVYPAFPFEDSDTTYLASVEKAYTDAIAADASAAGDAYVDIYTPSLAHSGCAPESTRWVEPAVNGPGAGPTVHPNATGHGYVTGVLAPVAVAGLHIP